MPIPSKFTAGDKVSWEITSGVNSSNESVTSTDYTCKTYLRRQGSSDSETITGTADSTGWAFVISVATSEALEPGTWLFQSLATRADPSDSVTLAKGTFEVEQKLSYTGTPTSNFEGRSQAQIDFEAVEAAIRSIVANKASEYTIADRTFKYADLGELRRLRSLYKNQMVREGKKDMIANGLGDPHQWRVRF